ncbi:MAG: hypothetical protein Tsb0021_08120 [Chlamydiales bacterium]
MVVNLRNYFRSLGKQNPYNLSNFYYVFLQKKPCFPPFIMKSLSAILNKFFKFNKNINLIFYKNEETQSSGE